MINVDDALHYANHYLSGDEGAELADYIRELHRNAVAIKELCKIYFDIAAAEIGEEEVRRRRDAIIDGRP